MLQWAERFRDRLPGKQQRMRNYNTICRFQITSGKQKRYGMSLSTPISPLKA